MAARRRCHTADEIVAILQEHTGGVTAREVIETRLPCFAGHGYTTDSQGRRP